MQLFAISIVFVYLEMSFTIVDTKHQIRIFSYIGGVTKRQQYVDVSIIVKIIEIDILIHCEITHQSLLFNATIFVEYNGAYYFIGFIVNHIIGDIITV